jgi:outer membrane protein OmpA-like peptidoglycan-associated protein
MYKTLKISILLLLPLTIFGQKTAKDWLKSADTYFENQSYQQALQAYEAFRTLEPANTEVLLPLGITYLKVGNIDEAKNILQYLVEQKKAEDKVYFFLAQSQHANGEYKEAIANFKKYLSLIKSTAPERKLTKEFIKRCANGLNFPDNTAAVFVQNMGDKVNSLYDDFGPVLSPSSDEKVYFSSAREGNIGGLRNAEGLRDDKAGSFCADMFVTKVTNGDWSEPKPLSYLINSPQHDVVLDFNSDGQQMYYFRGFTLFSGEIYVDTFKSFEERSLNVTPFRSPMTAPDYGDGTPFFVNDTLLFFSSRRAGGFGGADLYFTLYQNGAWTTPQNMGKNINTAYDEITPFLAIDGRTLYFSSNNDAGLGDFDIYKTVFDDQTLGWSKAENIGTPINSAGEDAFFRLSSDGTKGYFSSKRKDGLGGRDLYIAYYKNPLAEQDIVSTPDLFFKVKKKDKKNDDDEKNDLNKIKNYKFSSFTYDKDADLLSARNRTNLDNMVDFLTKNPNVRVVLASHSEETTTLDLDAFLAVKRAEKISDFLIKNGCNPLQISVLGCGAGFPLAQNIIEGNTNKIGQKFNRRVDLYFQNYQKLPVKLDIDEQIVPEYMQSGENFRFKNIIKGLSYRVQIASLKQMYQGDILKKYPDVLIEKAPNSDMYNFSIGLFTAYSNADRLQKDLVAQGITTAQVIPYINGFSVQNDAKNHVSQYSDLQNFVNKKK